MHVPALPVVLTVQELPLWSLPGIVGLGPPPAALAVVDDGLPGRPLGLLGSFFSCQPKHFGSPIGKEADYSVKVSMIKSRVPKQKLVGIQRSGGYLRRGRYQRLVSCQFCLH